MKLKDDFEKVMLDDKVAVNCVTEQEAKELLTALELRGYKWVEYISLTQDIRWNFCKEYTCYTLKCNEYIRFADKEYYKCKGYKIIPFSDLCEPTHTVDCHITENYLKEYARMCKSCSRCKVCPIEKLDNNKSCISLIQECPKEVLEIVQKWSDEHPEKNAMTYRDYLKKALPLFKKSGGRPCINLIDGERHYCCGICEKCYNLSIPKDVLEKLPKFEVE